MAYLGGIDSDERAMLESLISHFVTKLNEERRNSLDLRRRLELAEERLRLIDAVHYGLV